MMHRLVLLSLLAALVIGGCISEQPASDWCYRFDFTTSDYSFTLTYGRWAAGAGFYPDDQQRLAITYTHGQAVTPQEVRFYPERADSTPLPIKIVIKVDAFGLSTDNIQTTVPADVSGGVIDLAAGRGSGTSNKFEITAESSRLIVLRAMDVRGYGANPFVADNCYKGAIQPGATPIPFPGAEVIGIIHDADQSLGALGGDLTHPDGSPLLPNYNGQLLFGLVKYVISPVTAEALTGPFSPIFIALGLLLLLNIALIAVYLVVYIAVYLVRWAIWLFRLILAIMQAVAAAANGVIGWLLAFIGL